MLSLDVLIAVLVRSLQYLRNSRHLLTKYALLTTVGSSSNIKQRTNNGIFIRGWFTLVSQESINILVLAIRACTCTLVGTSIVGSHLCHDRKKRCTYMHAITRSAAAGTRPVRNPDDWLTVMIVRMYMSCVLYRPGWQTSSIRHSGIPRRFLPGTVWWLTLV
jgi:hypothetical protein